MNMQTEKTHPVDSISSSSAHMLVTRSGPGMSVSQGQARNAQLQSPKTTASSKFPTSCSYISAATQRVICISEQEYPIQREYHSLSRRSSDRPRAWLLLPPTLRTDQNFIFFPFTLNYLPIFWSSSSTTPWLSLLLVSRVTFSRIVRFLVFLLGFFFRQPVFCLSLSLPPGWNQVPPPELTPSSQLPPPRQLSSL